MTVGTRVADDASVAVGGLLAHGPRRPDSPSHELGSSLRAAARLLRRLGLVAGGVGSLASPVAHRPQLVLAALRRATPEEVRRRLEPLGEAVVVHGLVSHPRLVERGTGLLVWAPWHLTSAWPLLVPATVVRVGPVEYALQPVPVPIVGAAPPTAPARRDNRDPTAVLLRQLLGLYGLVGLVSVWPPAHLPAPAPVVTEPPPPTAAPVSPPPGPVPDLEAELHEELVVVGREETPPPPGRLRQAAVVGARWAVMVIAAVGVSIGTGHERSSSSRAATGRARPGRSVTAVAANPLGSGQPVTIAFGGDIHFEGILRRKLVSDPVGLLAPIRPVLASADLTVANLETAITERGVRQVKQFNFRAPASGVRALRAAGVDVVTLANNHGMDYGPEGLRDTLAAARSAGLAVVGAGEDAADAYSAYHTQIKGQRIAVIGATQVIDNHLVPTWTATSAQPGLASAKDVRRLADEVRAARAAADTVVVFLHWGIEGHSCPSPEQVRLARQVVDAGADIVVGGHSHRLQGAGRLGDAFVAYGLGNLVFYAREGPGADSGVLKVTATGRRIDSYHWTPARIGEGVPRPWTGARADRALRTWSGLRACTGLSP